MAGLIQLFFLGGGGLPQQAKVIGWAEQATVTGRDEQKELLTES